MPSVPPAREDKATQSRGEAVAEDLMRENRGFEYKKLEPTSLV